MITFDQVSLSFPLGNTALENVSFEIADNEFVFLVGKSGAGKTTILKLLLHEYAPTSGSIIVDDLNISKRRLKNRHKYRQRIGVVFQDFKILYDKNVFENIAIGLQVKGYQENEIRDEVFQALQLVGLPKKEFVFPAQLSAGELQRVAIARAIIGNRDIILADEPTGNLDPKTTWEVMKIFKKIAEKKTILFATHNSDIVNSFRKRVLVMKDGALIKDIRKGGYDL
jgi:cell division transport system ATP-binding protein